MDALVAHGGDSARVRVRLDERVRLVERELVARRIDRALRARCQQRPILAQVVTKFSRVILSIVHSANNKSKMI